MNKTNVWFIIVTYRPRDQLGKLLGGLRGMMLVVVDNTERNLGYGGGANVGMKKAFSAGARWAVVVNQDVTLTRTGIMKFAEELERCEPGIIGPEAGSLDPKRWTTILPTSKKIDYISGSLMAIHRDVYEATDGFYEPYFMYYEDADISLRAKKAGFGLRQLDIDGFGHETHGSPGKNYYLARNHLLFVFRNAPFSVKLYELIRLPKTIWELLWS